MKPADPLAWLREIIPDAAHEDRAVLEAVESAMYSAQVEAHAAAMAAATAMEGMPPAVEAHAAAAAAAHAAAVEATAALHLRVMEWQAKRAVLWRTAAVLAAFEGYRDVRELAESEAAGRWENRAVTDALESAELDGKPDPLAAVALADDGKRGQYAGEMLGWARKVGRSELFEGEPPATEDEARATVPTIYGPALRWDASFADLLDTVGAKGRELADNVREAAAARTAAALNPVIPGTDPPPAGALWRVWADLERGRGYSPRWLRLLAKALWADKWKPALERERAKPPAVWGPLFELLDRVHRPGGRIVDGELLDRKGNRVLAVRRDEPLPVAVVHLEALGMLVRDGAGMLGSLTAHRLTRWAISTAHARALNGEPDARVLRADGGWTALAGLVGARSKKAPGELRAIVSALAHLWFPLPAGRGGNLLTYTESAAAGNWRSCVEITLGTALLPHFVNGIPRGTDRDLVPLPPLPPFVGRPNEHGAQAAMQLGTMAHLRTRAAELVRHGGVLVTPDQWAELAKTHGLPADMLAAVLDRWTHNGDDGPAFLEALGGNRYRIAGAHPAVQAFLLGAGRMEVNGADLAKLSGDKKRKRLKLD